MTWRVTVERDDDITKVSRTLMGMDEEHPWKKVRSYGAQLLPPSTTQQLDRRPKMDISETRSSNRTIANSWTLDVRHMTVTFSWSFGAAKWFVRTVTWHYATSCVFFNEYDIVLASMFSVRLGMQPQPRDNNRRGLFSYSCQLHRGGTNIIFIYHCSNCGRSHRPERRLCPAQQLSTWYGCGREGHYHRCCLQWQSLLKVRRPRFWIWALQASNVLIMYLLWSTTMNYPRTVTREQWYL